MKINLTMRIALILGACVLLSTACSTGPRPSHDASPQDRVILRMVGPRETIVGRSSPGGPTYSLESSDGALLIPGSTLEELEARHPEFHQRIRTMETRAPLADVDFRDL